MEKINALIGIGDPPCTIDIDLEPLDEEGRKKLEWLASEYKLGDEVDVNHCHVKTTLVKVGEKMMIVLGDPIRR